MGEAKRKAVAAANNETIEIITDPPGDQARDATMQEYIKLLLHQAKLMVAGAGSELKTDSGHASAVVLSVFSTTLMIYVRGYPKELHSQMFRDVGQYFERMATEAEVKGDDNGGASTPTN